MQSNPCIEGVIALAPCPSKRPRRYSRGLVPSPALHVCVSVHVRLLRHCFTVAVKLMAVVAQRRRAASSGGKGVQVGMGLRQCVVVVQGQCCHVCHVYFVKGLNFVLLMQAVVVWHCLIA